MDEKQLKGQQSLRLQRQILREMKERKRLGLPLDIDPFDESFPTGVLFCQSGDENVGCENENVLLSCSRFRTGCYVSSDIDRGARKQNLRAGATNLDDGRSVAITLIGEASKIESFARNITSMKELNGVRK